MKRLQYCILTAVLALICFTSASAQQHRVSLQLKNVSLAEFFKAVEKQTDYMFSYDENSVSKAKDITVSGKDQPLSEILPGILAKKGLSYQMVSNKSIVILKENEKVAEPARSKFVSGKVVDSKGDAVIGASIMEKGTSNGVVTDINGDFSLNVSSQKETLVVSSIGYVTEELTNYGKGMTIILKDDVLALEGVVVTAMGIVRNTRELSYSTQSFRGEDLTKARSNSGNVLDELKGKIAGADISTNGMVGGASKIVLRGTKSIKGGQNALVVVDGVPFLDPVNNQVSHKGYGFAGTDGMLDINPDDIQSIDIMKGPAAAALYGSEGANGAIIITTKKGRVGSSQVTYSGSFSAEVPMFLMEMQNEFGRGNGGVTGTDVQESWGAATGKCVPDNWKNVYETGYNASNAIGFQGGNDKVQGIFSYTNNQIHGNTYNNKLDKHTFNLRVSANPVKRLHTDAKVTFTKHHLANSKPIGDTGLGVSALIMPRDLSIDELNNYGPIDEGTGMPVRNYWAPSSVYDSPMWLAHYCNRNEDRTRLIMNASIKYDITSWLNIQGRYGYDMYRDFIEDIYYDGTRVGPQTAGGNYSIKSPFFARDVFDVLLSGDNKFGDFTLTYNLGASKRHDHDESSSYSTGGLTRPNIFEIENAVSKGGSYSHGDEELQSVYATAQIGWRDALYFDATARNDWSSTLPAPYSYFYPSFGLTAILSELLPMPEWIDFAKLRNAYSDVGSSADRYMLAEIYTPNAKYGYVTPDSVKKITDLKPEHTHSWEIGAEFQFINRRLGFDFTYYQSNTTNQLVYVGVPTETGYKQAYVNCGLIENKGFELSLNATPVLTPDFSWVTTVNFGHNENTLVELYKDMTEYQIGGDEDIASTWAEVGKDLGRIRAKTWKQDDQGRYIVDANGLPVITSTSQDIGGSTPKCNWGWHNTFHYKQFSLDLQIDGRIGGTIISSSDAYGAYYGVTANTLPYRTDSWVLEGTVHEDGTPNTTAITSEAFWKAVAQARQAAGGFFAFDATTARLRSLSLSYDFNLGKDNFVKMARIAVTGRNLLMLYRGKNKLSIPGLEDRKIPVDPESFSGIGSYQGVETGLTPATRSFGVSVNLTF